MSTWNIGMNDVSEEMQAMKDKLSNKESRIAAQEARILKQAAEMEELRQNLNETLHKLSREADRAIGLEQTVTQYTQDLRNERIAYQNITAALNTAHEKHKQQSAELKQLEGTLQTISHTSNGHNVRGNQLEQEKRTLEGRVRELESTLQRHHQSLSSTPRQPPAARPRSSSLSRLQISSLERELREARSQLSQRESELESTKQRLSHLQTDLVKSENEKLVVEKRCATRIADLECLLSEKAGDAQDLENYRLGSEREEELLRRIEEDDAKIAALEKLANDTHNTGQLQDKLKRVERRLKEEAERVKQLNAERLRLQKDREETSSQLRKTQQRLSEKTTALEELQKAQSTSSAAHITAQDPPDVASVQHVERLLAAVNRLRVERDGLRCDLQFLQTETSFTIQSLESKLAHAFSGDLGTGNSSELSKIEDTQIRRISRAAAALSLVVARQHHLLTEAGQELHDTQHDLADQLAMQATKLDELLEEKNTLEVKLDVTTACLEAATSQRDDVLSQLDAKESEWAENAEQINMAYHDACRNVERLEHQVNDLTKALEVVEGERDSTRLQVTHLTTELQTVREELSKAENRYSALQFHQLSAMTDSEATRALREQIRELELRVMRRTEQIGIHQHDIRRLETNLRLQEERLGEMTVELETLGAQKDTMVEDCADAREARDDALRQVEQLEVELETMEGKVRHQDTTLTTLVEVAIKSTGQARNALHQTHVMAQEHECQRKYLEDRHQEIVQQLHHQPSSVVQLNQQLSARLEECHQFVVALALCKTGYDSSRRLLQATLEDHDRLAEEIQHLQTSIETTTAHSQTLSNEVEQLHLEAQELSSSHQTEMSTLEKQLESLHNAMAEKELEMQTVVTRATQAEDRAQSLSQERELLTRSRLDENQTHSQHLEAVGALERQCREVSDSMAELQAHYDALAAQHESEACQQAQTIGDLEKHLSTATAQLEEVDSLRQELSALRKDQSSQIIQLQESLDYALQEVDTVKHARNAAHSLREEALEKLALVEASYDDAVKSAERLRNELEDQVQALHSTIESQTQDLNKALTDVQCLTGRLESEAEARTQSQEAHKEQMDALCVRLQAADSLLGKLQQELSDAQQELSEARHTIQTLGEERQILQEETTSLKAENQRSISFHRFLESQVRESETQISSLKDRLEQAHAETVRSETAVKTTELNLSLQTAQHKRELADIRSELNTLRSRPNLEHAMAELEERNNEMEELLRKKCAEIEENDDKALEMLKNNKKLSNKVESLTRKVQNLQTKLNAAKATQPAQPPAAPEPGPSVSAAPLSISSLQPALELMTPSAQPPLHRMVSMPSFIPRPKTPERRAVVPHVYRDPTPERLMPSIDLATTSSIGRKRPAPDDFDACEGLPPQAFTADSVPKDKTDQTTPRVRRAFSNAHSGFTPVRRRPPAPVSSPQRASSGQTSASPFIVDVTNSPRRSPYSSSNPSAKASKRSWLGKIRGASAHPVLPPSSRPKLDRDSDS